MVKPFGGGGGSFSLEMRDRHDGFAQPQDGLVQSQETREIVVSLVQAFAMAVL